MSTIQIRKGPDAYAGPYANDWAGLTVPILSFSTAVKEIPGMVVGSSNWKRFKKVYLVARVDVVNSLRAAGKKDAADYVDGEPITSKPSGYLHIPVSNCVKPKKKR
jgi:hypothetical protein